MNKAIFWDFHRTLAYSTHIWGNSLLKAAKTVCPDTSITFEQIEEHLIYGFPWQVPENDYTKITGSKWWDFMYMHFEKIYKMFGLSEQDSNKACVLAREMILDYKKYSLYDDTISTLEACIEKGFKNYIVSNNYPELEELMKNLKILKYFDGLVVSAIIGYDKPRTEIFDYAKNLANNPEICYMVGDSVECDVYGGKRSGMKTILVHNSVTCNADYICENLCDILNVIE